MFTGLVQRVGVVRAVDRTPKGARIEVACDFESLVLGESIATHGVCLTVVSDTGRGFVAEASAETLEKSTLGRLTVGRRVHLERALRAADKLGGHLVTGHVDGVGRLASRVAVGDALRLGFEVPAALAPFLAPKGSVTIDGTSLTINGARSTQFDVMLVPFTQKETSFVDLVVGDEVNLEVDVLAKYVARLLGRPGVDGAAADNPGGVTLDLLRHHGYLGNDS